MSPRPIYVAHMGPRSGFTHEEAPIWPVRVHPAPALPPPRRPGLVALTAPRRDLAEVHEDVARLGWPPGGWCE